MVQPGTAERGRLAGRWERLTGSSRLGGVDLARGLAVMGMFAAHLLPIPEWSPLEPATWAGLVHGRSSILFATLAGVSIGLVSGGTRPVTGPELRVVRLRLIVRAIVLWMIGLLLFSSGVPVYVILPAYALLFLLALPLLSLSPRVLFALAAALAVVMPFVLVPVDDLALWSGPNGALLGAALGWHYPFLVWIAYVTAGIGIARLGLRRIGVQIALVGVGTVLAVVAYGVDAVTRRGGVALGMWQPAWSAAAHSDGVLEAVGSGGFAMAVMGLCLLVCRTPIAWIALPLRAVGSMPLTAYSAHLVVWAVWAATVLGSTGDLAGFRALAPFPPIALGILAGCTAWALLIGRGPLEWAIDRLARLVVPRR